MTEAGPPITDDLPTPSELAGYPAVRELGSGTDGHVYEVRAADGSPLAVKLLEDAAPVDQAGTARLARRVRTLAILDHPRLVRIHDLVPAGRNLCVVMEFVAGETLRDVLARRRPSSQDVGRWVTQLAEAIDYLHLLGVVHRDVKPANVLIDTSGDAKLADLALADPRVEDPAAPPVLGTPAYLAPELVRGDQLVDGRADIYSLATIAYEALAGVAPFAGLGAEETLDAQLRRRPPDPSRVIPGFPEPVAEVLFRGLAKAPADRPATAGAFAEALSAALVGERTRASALVRVPETDDAALRTRPAPITSTRPAARTLPRRLAVLPLRRPISRPLLAVALVFILGAAALFGYGGYAYWKHVTTPPPPLHVKKATVSASPAEVHAKNCVESVRYTFRGYITTNGQAGVVHYTWTENGSPAPSLAGQVRVKAKQRHVTVTRSFEAASPRATTTFAIVFIAGKVPSAPAYVTYSCPH